MHYNIIYVHLFDFGAFLLFYLAVFGHCWRALVRQQPILDISEKNQILWDVRLEAWAFDCGVIMSIIRGIDTRDDIMCMWKGILQPHSLRVEYFSSETLLIIIQP